MKHLLSRVSLAFVLACLARDASAQLVTENAGVVSPESPMARLTIRGSQWRHVDEAQAVGEFRYAFHPRFEGAAFVPLITRRFEIGGDHERRSGLGDVAVQGKVNILKQDGVMSSLRAAVFGGIEFPTGTWDDTLGGSDVPFTRKLQLGSGTFDFKLGAAFTYIADRHRVAVDAWGQASTSRGEVSPGPVIRIDASYWFRLFPAVFEPGESGMELRLVVDAWYLHRYHTRGEAVDDSADQVWIAPGVQFHVTKWLTIEGSFGFNLADSSDDEYGRAQWTGFIAGSIHF